MRLSDCVEGKDNNFNLIRVVAALTVLLAHSFPLSEGWLANTSFVHAVAGTAASFAVYVFFAVSGFLVTRSMLSRQSVRDFLVARAFRIYPALWLVTIVLTFVVGTAFTVLPVDTYLAAQKTYFYFLKVSTLIFGVAFGLPGVFESNPFPASVNGSLWTLPHEVRLYLLLVVTWWLTMRKLNLPQSAFKWIVTSVGCMLLMVTVVHGLNDKQNFFLAHAAMFCWGAIYYLHRATIVMRWRYVLLALIAVVCALCLSKDFLTSCCVVVLPYIVFALAYLPRGHIRRYNRMGDYSYGLYIYAFPIQQILVAVWADVAPVQLAVASTLLTLPIAIISWHWVEKPAVVYASRLTR